MIKEFDALAITTENYDKLSAEEKKERIRKREELLKKMSDAEIQELLSRAYPSQFKQKINQVRRK